MKTLPRFFDKKNKSTLFALPLIEGIPKVYFSDCINCYIASEFSDLTDEGVGVIYVAFNKSVLESTYFSTPNSSRAIINSTRVEILQNHPNFIKVVDADIFDVYCYNLEDKYVNDVWAFLNGKYSTFSKDAKRRILNYYSGYPKLQKILNPTKADKREFSEELGLDSAEGIDELLSKPNWEQETFKLSHFLIIEE